MTRPRQAAIVGAALSDYPRAPHLSERQHHAQALSRALASAGLKIGDIDGYMAASMGQEQAISLAEYFRIDHKVLGGVGIGGAIFEWMVHQAAAQIEAGQCDTVAITYGSDLLSRSGRTLGTAGFFREGDTISTSAMFEAPYGSTIVGAYAMAARRHMHEFGTTSEQLAAIAVTCREHAALNPNALYRKPITVSDVLASRMVADPLHMLDCCVISDGGGAVILTTAERARDLPVTPAYVLGTAATQSHWNISEMPDFTVAPSATAGPRAFARAGLTPADVDTIQLYDSFTITVLLMLEGLGFCSRGEGGALAESGALRLGGRWPMNTDGGGLSACHSGMRGMHILVEAVRQLRGEAGPAQVPDAKVALVCGSGGWLSGHAVVILGTEQS
ncbi:MAG: acetyl-CoA acetyltransferase [Gammaproteobacteria bacterium]